MATVKTEKTKTEGEVRVMGLSYHNGGRQVASLHLEPDETITLFDQNEGSFEIDYEEAEGFYNLLKQLLKK